MSRLAATLQSSGGSGISSVLPIHRAARDGNLPALQQLLQDGADVNAENARGWTPVHCAARGGHAAAIQALVDAGAGVNGADKNQWTPLHLAAHFGHADCISALVAAGANVDCVEEDGWTPVHCAADNGHANTISALLEAGAAVDSVQEDGLTPLHLAANGGHVDAVIALLTGDANVHSIEADGWTPLHFAAQSGHAGAIQALLDAGANVDYLTKKGNTPQHLVASNGHADAMRALLTANPKPFVDSRQEDGMTPLHCASINGDMEVVKDLLEAGASVLSVTDDGWTPLHYAAGNGHAGALQALLGAGASVHNETDKGSTALHLAANFGHADIISVLLEAGANVNCKAQRGQTPLHWAAHNGHIEAIQVLLRAGARKDCKDNRGHSPLDFARKQKKEAAVKALKAAAKEVDENWHPSQAETGGAFKFSRLFRSSTAEQKDDDSDKYSSVQQAEEDDLQAEMATVIRGPRQLRHQPTSRKTGTAPATQPLPGPPTSSAHGRTAFQPPPPSSLETIINMPSQDSIVVSSSSGGIATSQTPPHLPGTETLVNIPIDTMPQMQGTETMANIPISSISSAGPDDTAENGGGNPSPSRSKQTPEGLMYQRQQIKWSDVQLMKKLGSGGFGEVWHGRWKGANVAVKVLKDMEEGGAILAHTLKGLQAEAALMAQLHHPHIVQFLGFCFEPKPAVLMQLCTNDSLASVLRRAREDPQGKEAAMLTWRRRIEMLQNAASGMLYLHTCQPQVLHRDLKSPNLLVAQDGSLKVADFGLSRLVETATANSGSTLSNINPRWLAPELVRDESPATPASDVFAFGLVMWEMLTWQLPWPTLQRPIQICRSLDKGLRPTIPDAHELPGAGSGAWDGLCNYLDLLKDCWAEDPGTRPGFDVVVQRLDELLDAAE